MIAAVAILIVTTLLTIYSGLVATILWSWFMVPLGLPPIGLAHALGLCFLFQLFHGWKADYEDRDTEELLAIAFVYPTFVLFLGFLANIFMP